MAEAHGPIHPGRPDRFDPASVPDLPDVHGVSLEQASTEYSHYRTGLSRHRTGLSEHRTDLSEYRTDLSGDRTELSMRRTGMSIQRTRMSGDRTLMSVIRTSLSLIAFGFTLYQAFEKLQRAGAINSAAAPSNFGMTLILLGILVLVGGIWRHVQFARELRGLRSMLQSEGLIHGESDYPVSLTLLAAILLMLVGVAAVASIVFDIQLFG